MTASLKKKNIILTAILIVFSISLIRTTAEILGSNRRLGELKTEVAKLEDEKVQLEEEIEHKQSLEYVEEVARNELNMVKPNEKVYVVSGSNMRDYATADENTAGVLGGETKKDTIEDSNIYLWYRLFF